MSKDKTEAEIYADEEEYCECKEPDTCFDRSVTEFSDGSSEWGFYYCGACGKHLDERETSEDEEELENVMPLVNPESIAKECDNIKEVLLSDNECYGVPIDKLSSIIRKAVNYRLGVAPSAEYLDKAEGQNGELNLIKLLIIKRVLDNNDNKR